MSDSGPTTRIETERVIAASPADVFAVLCDPQGHVAIDSSGMLQDATGTLGILDRTVRRGYVRS